MTEAPVLGCWLSEAAIRWPDRDGLVFGERRWSYASLGRWQAGIVAWLVEHGVAPSDRVLWQLPNSPLALVLNQAILSLGAISVPVPMLYREHELGYIVSDSQPSAVIAPTMFRDRTVTDELDRVLAATGTRPSLRAAVGGTVAGWDVVPEERELNRPPVPDRPPIGDQSSPVLVMYTSGSTADPKGVIHTSGSLVNTARIIGDWCQFGPDECFVTGAPVAHIAGLLAVGILPLSCGGTAVLMPRWNPTTAAHLIARERATFSCGATVFLRELVDLYESDASFDHHLRRFVCGGSAVPPSLIERADAQAVLAFRSWGMTEAPMIGMARMDDPLELRSRSDGRVCTGAQVDAVDEDRRPLPEGIVGELRLRASQQMAGYTDPAVTAAQVDAEGWFYSGDLGFVRDGVLTMTGRIKDIINRGGEKFSARDIENAIAEHPSVAEVTVYSIPDDRLGETVAAAVELRTGTAWPGDAVVEAFLADKGLARQKVPQHWRVVDVLPRTASGKVRKEQLRAEFDTRPGWAPGP